MVVKYEETRLRSAQSAFTLVELLIVVAILGIMAAIAVPMFQGHSLRAKEVAARDNLRILREAIGRYTADNGDIPPGYSGNNPDALPIDIAFRFHLVPAYISDIPENPFNNKSTPMMVANETDFPSEPTVTHLFGWIYKPATKTIKLNWPGTDAKAVTYFDY